MAGRREKDDRGGTPAGGSAAASSSGAGASTSGAGASTSGAGRTAGAGGPARTEGTTPAPTGRKAPSQSTASRLAWIAVTVAALLTAWQVVYALTAPTSPSSENYASVSLLLTLVLSVGAVVLGIVALGQRAQPRWPATAATAVGVFAFIVAVATWIGTLMA